MKRAAIVGVLLGFTLTVSLGIVWDATWEGRPTGAELASDLDLFIREFKQQVADRASVETIYGVGTDDNGLARLGSARAFIQNAAPANMVGPGQFNSTADVFPGAALADEEVGASTVDQGTGRLWVDADGLDGVAGTQDDRQLNVWTDTVGFQSVTASPTIIRPIGNLIYNGSFEITDGTGAVASALCPLAATGGGWVNLANAPTCAYQDPAGVTEGEGIAINITGAVGVDSGIGQTLTALKASTTYVIRARVNPTTAGDTCDLSVTGGTVTPVTDVSGIGTAVFETLEVVVTTTAVPAALVVRLESNAVGDVCRWDHVTAFEQDAVVQQPGIQVCRVQSSTVAANLFTNAAWIAATGLACSVTPPGPGYIVKVTSSVLADNDGGGGAGLAARIVEGATPVAWAWDDGPSAVVGGIMNPVLGFTRVNPAPGTTLAYTVEAQVSRGAGGPVDFNIDDAAETEGDTPVSWIQVELIPTR